MFRQVSAVLLFAIALHAQTPAALPPPLAGVSEPLRNYSQQSTLQDPAFGAEVDMVHTSASRAAAQPLSASLVTSGVTAPASTMVNQTSNATLPVTINKNYAGLGTGFNASWINQGVTPAQPSMGVGLTQIVQWVNIRLTVLDKSTGLSLLGGTGFVNGNQIWAGLGATSVCATKNQGDPNVQYDRLAGRWVLSQFAFISALTSTDIPYPAAPYAICMAVSQTSDATGAYNLYQFLLPNLPDNEKLAIWPDAYYTTDVETTYSTTTGSATFAGSRVCAYDRAAMIAGSAAPGSVCFSDLNLDASQVLMLAADFEGTILPPANETEFIVNSDWFSKFTPPYVLQLRRFHPDFATPANSTLTDGLGGAFNSFVALPFDSTVVGACADLGGQCVPQPGTTRKLETATMHPMQRLAYRNLGANRETLVFSETVDPVGSAVAGLQLVEIRNPGASLPSIYNNVNFNPDSTSRWMGSAASDKLGNVALGYNVSSAVVPPGLRITGRLRNDLRNSVRGEMFLQDGSGSQTSNAQRWGPISTMQIDPADDCTFWYTGEYMSNTSSTDWATRIAAFKFNNCQ